VKTPREAKTASSAQPTSGAPFKGRDDEGLVFKHIDVNGAVAAVAATPAPVVGARAPVYR
jgi:hypothetical protein